MKGEIKEYPETCKSWACGRIICPDDCHALAKLKAWKKWKAETKATQTDKIYSPCSWTATQ